MYEFQRNGLAPPRVFTPRSAANPTDSRKHKVVVETITQEKKKLRSVLTFKAQAPLGYTFIPAGNPQLTNALKEAARQENEQIFAVSTTPHQNVHDLSQQVHRIGFHFPNRIIDLVCIKYGIKISSKGTLVDQYGSVPLRVTTTSSNRLHKPSESKAGEDQITINTKAKEAITDLFPNIPNEDLWKIIKTAFQKGQHKVGTANELPLVRRAQLAVVAHIRHVYTDYDKLLRRGGYHTARTRVEKPTLEKLVAWRGDDENGSKMMEDVLKEVVVISDDESSEDETANKANTCRKRHASVETVSSDDDLRVLQVKPVTAGQIYTSDDSDRSFSDDQAIPGTRVKPVSKARAESRRERDRRRGFDRYRHIAWDTAREQYRADPTQYTRAVDPVAHLSGDRTPPPLYISTRAHYAEPSSGPQPVSVSGRADAEASQTILANDNRNYRSEGIPRKVHYDPPETVRLADGFLYERVPRPILVRSERSITPDLPASPTHRRQPLPGSLLPRRDSSSHVLPSNSTARQVERTRHDPETAIPSIERDLSPDSPFRLPLKPAQSYEPGPRAVVGHKPKLPMSYQPVEHLSNRVEVIRLDGAKRRLDEAFPLDRSQDQPRKLYRSDPTSEVPYEDTRGQGDTNVMRSGARPLEGRSAVTSGIVRTQASPNTPRLIRQAISVRNPAGSPVHSTVEPYSHRLGPPDPSREHTGPRLVERSQMPRSSTKLALEIDRPHNSAVWSPALSSNISHTVSSPRPEFPGRLGSTRSFARYEAALSSPNHTKIYPPSKKVLERDRTSRPQSNQAAHHDRIVRPEGHSSNPKMVSNVGDRYYPSRRSTGDLPVDSSKGQSNAIFLGAIGDHDRSLLHASRTASIAVPSMPRESHDRQSNGYNRVPELSGSTRRIEYTSAAEEIPLRRHLVQSHGSGHKRYIDPIVNPKFSLTESSMSGPYSHALSVSFSVDDSQVIHG